MREAQRIRRGSGNVIADERRIGRQIEEGAFKYDRKAGDMLRHEPHPDDFGNTNNRYPHYQTNRKRGHTFYRRVAFFFAPFSMSVSGRKDATNGQMLSAIVWDITGAPDPIGLTGGLNSILGLEPDEE
jgi:hypothetical protein